MAWSAVGNGKDDRIQNTDFRFQKLPLKSEICILNSVIFAVPSSDLPRVSKPRLLQRQRLRLHRSQTHLHHLRHHQDMVARVDLAPYLALEPAGRLVENGRAGKR